MAEPLTFFARISEWNPLPWLTTKVRNKLMVAFVGVSLVPLIVLGVILNRSSSNALMRQATANLEAVHQLKQSQLESYFQIIHDQVQTLSEDRMVIQAAAEFPAAIANVRQESQLSGDDVQRIKGELKSFYTRQYVNEFRERSGGKTPPLDRQLKGLDGDAIYLQYLYIQNNPHPVASKSHYDRAEDNSSYSKLHEKYHPALRSFQEKFGFADIYLCDPQSGHVVYSVAKGVDFATSLKDGPYSDTHLGRAFQLAASASAPGGAFVEFAPYLADFEQPAGFLASPVFDGDRKVGVLIFQLSLDRLQQVVANTAGLGSTGESYLVGSDQLLRTQARYPEIFETERTALNPDIKVNTTAAEAAQKGTIGSGTGKGYRGTQVLATWSPVSPTVGSSNATPFRWAFVSEIDLQEVMQPINASGMMRNTTFVVALSTLAGLIFALFAAQGITRQAEAITDMLSNIGIGDYDARADIITNDELGNVAVALNAMCDNTLTLIQSREERDEIQESIGELMRELKQIAAGDLTIQANVKDNITRSVSRSINFMTAQLRQIVRNVMEATEQVGVSANQIRRTTEQLNEGSDHQAKQIMETSSAVEEMVSAIQHVAENTERSAVVAEEARRTAERGASAVSNTIQGMEKIRDQVQDTAKRIKRLGESSQEIGEIVQLISDIADRTSILALNASIQAAMAGDAGQGFAVVAEEVERLAERSNDATKQIATLIKAIQSETAEAIAGMEESTREVVEGSKLAAQAGQTLTAIDDVSNRLAELINNISSTTKSQSHRAESISRTMNEIANITRQTSSSTKHTAVSVSHLSVLADQLRTSVGRFKLPDSRDPATYQGTASAQAPTAAFPPPPEFSLSSTGPLPTSSAPPASVSKTSRPQMDFVNDRISQPAYPAKPATDDDDFDLSVTVPVVTPLAKTTPIFPAAVDS